MIVGIKADLYKKDLCDFLGIDNLNEIKEEHSDKLLEFAKKYNDKETFKEILKTIPNFISLAKNVLDMMRSIVKEVIGFSKAEISALQTIITQLESLLKDNNLTEHQKDKIIELQFKYQETLRDMLEHNQRLKEIVLKGGITLGAMVLVISGYWITSVSGGKINADSLENSAQKLIEKT